MSSSHLRVKLLLGLGILLLGATAAMADANDIDFKSKSADYFEHTIDFMVAIALGTFAVLGWVVKDSKVTSKARWAQQIAAALAAVMGAASLYFGYKSHLDLVEMTGSGAFSYGTLPLDYSWQAFMLLLELPCLFAVLLITTVWKQP